jgi:hypothetical protein
MFRSVLLEPVNGFVLNYVALTEVCKANLIIVRVDSFYEEQVEFVICHFLS